MGFLASQWKKKLFKNGRSQFCQTWNYRGLNFHKSFSQSKDLNVKHYYFTIITKQEIQLILIMLYKDWLIETFRKDVIFMVEFINELIN